MEHLGFVARSIGAQEHRGCPSPLVKGFLASGSNGKEDGRAGCRVAHKRRKNWVKMTQVINYTIGEDIGWDRIELMANLMLVGRFVGRTISVQTVVKWAEDCWQEAMGAAPKVEGLARKWFAFNF